MEKNNTQNLPFKRKKAAEHSFNPFDVGKLPPQAPDLEEAVLGAIMLEKGIINTILDILTPECFYVDAHSRIFNACTNLLKAKQPIDILTVTNQLKKSAELEIIGGAYYISSLTNRVASSANLKYHAAIVYQKFLQRKVIEISTQAIRQAFEDETDVSMLFDWLINELSLTSMKLSSMFKGAVQVKDVWEQVRERNAVLLLNEGINGVPSGFNELDGITGGWQKSDLIILAARPAMGKTAFALGIAKNAAMKFNKKVAFFSLEMSEIQLVTRMAADESGVQIYKWTKQGIPEDEFYAIENTLSKLMDCPVYIDDTPALSIFALKAKVRQMMLDLGIDMVIIDYLQLMRGEEKMREQEISAISRGLKEMAKEFQIPVMALSQLNRSVETRGGDKRPKLSDLRESGAIEQDADLVAFLHRAEYYKDFTYSDGSSSVGKAEIIIEKHRNGDCTTVRLNFDGSRTKFSDLSESAPSPSNLAQFKNIDFTEPNSKIEGVKSEEDDLPF
jgi:replicative DNA helicase